MFTAFVYILYTLISIFLPVCIILFYYFYYNVLYFSFLPFALIKIILSYLSSARIRRTPAKPHRISIAGVNIWGVKVNVTYAVCVYQNLNPQEENQRTLVLMRSLCTQQCLIGCVFCPELPLRDTAKAVGQTQLAAFVMLDRKVKQNTKGWDLQASRRRLTQRQPQMENVIHAGFSF